MVGLMGSIRSGNTIHLTFHGYPDLSTTTLSLSPEQKDNLLRTLTVSRGPWVCNGGTSTSTHSIEGIVRDENGANVSFQLVGGNLLRVFADKEYCFLLDNEQAANMLADLSSRKLIENNDGDE